MSEPARVLVSLLDVRGRCNRRGLLIVASLLLGLEIVALLVLWATGAGFEGAVALALKLAFLWLAVAACARRLHDLGRSAWALAWAVPLTVLWSTALVLSAVAIVGLDAFEPSSPWYLGCMALSMVPVVAGTLWLHLARGQPGANRYGPEPAGLGFAAPQPAPAVAAAIAGAA